MFNHGEVSACPAASGPAPCRVPAPHGGGHLYVPDPVWARCATLAALYEEPPS